MGLRSKRRLLSLAFHITVLGLGLGSLWMGTNLESRFLLDLGGLVVLAHLLTWRRLALGRVLERRLLLGHRCLGCGRTFSLVDQWKCKCGFVSTLRSALGPCPQCRKGFAAVACPHCGTSALI